MRRFLFSTGLLSTLLGVRGVVSATRNGPRDWRLVLSWIIWGLGLAIAVGSVVEEARAAKAQAELED